MRALRRREAMKRWCEAGDRLRKRSPVLYAKIFALLLASAVPATEQEEENIDDIYTEC